MRAKGGNVSDQVAADPNRRPEEPNPPRDWVEDLNEGRLPSYHRLDVSIRRTFKDVYGGDLDFTAGVTNVYSRENVFYINRLTGQRKNQLPFLPSIALDWKF